MTGQHQTESLQEPNETIAQLTAALAANERRYATATKLLRWGIIILVMLGIAWIGFNPVDVAQAVSVGSNSEGNKHPIVCDPMDRATMQTQECAFEQVSQFFFMMNRSMEGTMKSPDVVRYMVSQERYQHIKEAAQAVDKAKQNILQFREKYPGKDVPKQLQDRLEQEQQKLGGLVMRDFPTVAGQIVVDFAVLVKRLRKDSDEFREYLAGERPDPGSPIGAVAKELHIMNAALASVPIMTAQMDLMNRNMAAMSYSMGSTMGRMGSIMPW